MFLCMCVYAHLHVWLYALAPERREALLPQLSTLALALKSDGPLLPGCPWTPCSPAHCSLGPRTREMIYYPPRERAQPQPLFTSVSILLPFISLHSLHPACQLYYFLVLSLSKRKIQFRSPVLSSHFILDSPFFTGFFPSYHSCLSSFLSVGFSQCMFFNTAFFFFIV